MSIVTLGTVLFVAAILFGTLEPTMTGLKTSSSSADMNSTIDKVASNTWSGLNLAVIVTIIIGAVILLRYTGLLGGG
jgi:hypothetical protein